MTTHSVGVTPTTVGSPPTPTDTAGPISTGSSALSAPAEPKLARVSVLSGRTQVDVALPADVAVASLLPELAGLLLRNQFGELDEVPDDLGVRWTLAKVGQQPLEESRTLIESGILDGDLLILRTDTTTELPTVYDDVIDAVAGISRRAFASWTSAAARWVGIVAFLSAVAASTSLIVITSWTDPHYDLAAMSFVAFVIMFIAGILARHNTSDRTAGAALTTGACLTIFAGAFAVLPGDVNAANVLLGAGLSALVAVLSMRVTAGDAFTHMALITVSILVAIGGLIQLLADWSVRDTAAALSVIALMVALIAPRLTILLVRLPIPAVPTAGASLEELDGPEQTNVNAGVAAIGAVALPETQALELRAKAATSHMSGVMLGASAVVAFSAPMCAAPQPHFHWQSMVLGVLVTAALILRSRSHSDLLQAAGLISTGAVGLFAVIATQLSAGGAWVPVSIGLALLIAVGSFTFGIITPHMEFSPVLRRMSEVLEYLIIAASVPLAAWVVGLYSLARGL